MLNYLGILVNLVNVISFFVDEIVSLCQSGIGISFHIEWEVRRHKLKLQKHAEKHSHAWYDLLYSELVAGPPGMHDNARHKFIINAQFQWTVSKDSPSVFSTVFLG